MLQFRGSMRIRVFMVLVLVSFEVVAYGDSPSVGQHGDVKKVLSAAVRRDKNLNVGVRSVGRTYKNGQWTDLKGTILTGPSDQVEDALEVDHGVEYAVGERSIDYGTSKWHHSLVFRQNAAFRQTAPVRSEVVANLPVGTVIEVILGAEKLDVAKIGLLARLGRGSEKSLAPANPKLPKLRVTRQDKSLPSGRALLRQTRIHDGAKGRGYLRRSSGTTARVAIRPRARKAHR